jgi:hypothetical protein
MNILHQIIGELSKEEVRHFKLYLTQTNAGALRKDVALFDAIRKNYTDFDEDKFHKKHYSNDTKNSLYRLKNRLFEDINRSLNLLYFDFDDSVLLLHYFILSRIYQRKQNFEIAFHYLSKAERRGLAIENYELLDLLYADFIKLSQETMKVNPEKYISLRKENRKKLQKIQEIDDVLAVLIYRIKVSQGFDRGNQKILEVLQKTIDEYSSKADLKNNTQLRLKIYQSLSRILLQRHDYTSLEVYLLDTYRSFQKENLFNKSNHETKLQMLTYLINSLFKNGKNKQSLEYAEKLKEAMEEFGGLMYDKYLFYYYNSLMINYSVSNKQKAIDILEEAKGMKAIKELPFYTVFVYLNLAVLNFGIKNFKMALKHLVFMSIQENFKNLDQAFQLKISLTELMIRYELNDYEFIENRINQIKRDFKSLLSEKIYERERELLKIVSGMIGTNSLEEGKAWSKRLTAFHQLAPSSADSDILNYNSWLKSKFNSSSHSAN